MANRTAKLIGRIAENLPDLPRDIAQDWIEDPWALRKALESALVVPQIDSVAWRMVWRSVKLGGEIKDGNGFIEAIRDAGMSIGDLAFRFLQESIFTVASRPSEVDLVVHSVSNFGFLYGAVLEKIYYRAKKRGLQLCPFEVAPLVRLALVDQAHDTELIIATETFTVSDPDAGSLLLSVDCEFEDRSLSCHFVNSKAKVGSKKRFSPNQQFVFMKPRK